MKSLYKIVRLPLITIVVYGFCRGFLYDKIGLPFWNYVNISEGLWLDVTICIASVLAFLFAIRFNSRYYSSTHKGIFLSIIIVLILFNLDNDIVPYLLFFKFCPSWIPIAVGLTIGFIGGRCSKCSENHLPEQIDAPLLFKDDPISSSESDEFAFNNLAQRIAYSIERKNSLRSFSIGITGAWGSGKTSLLNLIKNNLSKNHKNVIVEFSPRQSASVSDIQKDFLSVFSEKLVKYHSGMHKLMNKYSQAIGAIPDNIWPVRLFFGYNHLSPQQLRKKINKIISCSGVRIIVLIDDFDRLSGDEIKEVLKLIDKNAAFPNTFFLTAYDKERTNDVIAQALNDAKKSDYTDKYFSLEIPVPIRRPGHYIHILRNHVLDMVKLGNLPYSLSTIDSAISRVKPFIGEYLPTVRDIKRYANYLAVSIAAVKDDVLLDDFMLVSLIRYKHPLEYRNLAEKQYIAYTNSNDGLVYHSPLTSPSSQGLLKNLFGLGNGSYRSIKRVDAFEFYFYDIDSGHLSLGELSKVLKPNISAEEFKQITQLWVHNKDYRRDFIEFILSRRDLVRSKVDARSYIRLYLLARTFCNDYSLYQESILYLGVSNIYENMRAFGCSSSEEYIQFFKDVFTEALDDILTIEFLHDALHAVAHINPDDAPSLIFSYDELIVWAQEKLDGIIKSVDLGKAKREDVFNAMKACVVEFNPEGEGESISQNAKEQVRTAMRNNPQTYLENILCHKIIDDNVIQFYLKDEDVYSILFKSPAEFNLFLSIIANKENLIQDNCLDEYVQRCIVQDTWTPSFSVKGNVNDILQSDYAMYNKLFEGEPVDA